jgi:DNA-binding transcriptional MerR regulator
MTIDEAARTAGLTADTIRHPEREGMLPCRARDARGPRQFVPGDVDRLANLARLRATGPPTAEMQRFARLTHRCNAGDPAVIAERLSILRARKAWLAARRGEIGQAEAFGDHKITAHRERYGQGHRPLGRPPRAAAWDGVLSHRRSLHWRRGAGGRGETDDDISKAAIRTAVPAGIRLFDRAQAYGARHPCAVPLPGFRTPEQVRDVASALAAGPPQTPAAFAAGEAAAERPDEDPPA